MRKFMKLCFVFLAVIILAGCGGPGIARLYPINDAASRVGSFAIVYQDVGLSGSVNFTTPDGERFTGSYTTIRTGSVGRSASFGHIYGLQFGRSATAYSFSRRTVSPRSLPGVLNAFGSRGTSIDCEYLIDRRTRSGTGACRTNKGAIYRMHFGLRGDGMLPVAEKGRSQTRDTPLREPRHMYEFDYWK